MNKSRGEDQEIFALKYGALEALLVELMGGDGTSIATRFRKLRPKFAADGILSETGGNVSYDLTRVLAICATYELNALSIPQGSAVEIVVANWPEIARACLTAWIAASEGGQAGHRDRAPVVRIYIDSLNALPEGGSWASLQRDPVPQTPHVVLDCRPMVDALTSAAEQAGQSARLTQAFVDLERTCGWEALEEGAPERLPTRKESGFFGTGPYFDRARALLAVNPETKLHGRRRAHLQALLGYLEEPAPIDSWKRYIGTDVGKTRLIHILAAWGRTLGLASCVIGEVDTYQISFLDRPRAIDLIARGEAHLAALRSGKQPKA